MAIPARVREALAASCDGRVTLTAHEFEGCVSIYPEAEWQCVLKKLNALPNANRKVQALLRRVVGHAVELEMDANGRVLVPPTLRDFAGFEKRLMLDVPDNKIDKKALALITNSIDSMGTKIYDIFQYHSNGLAV